MSVNTKMKAIADEVRELSGTTEAMGLDAMASNVGEANAEVNTQTELLTQAISVLKGKASGSTPVQANWNQNDETADDYVKNRPFYAEDPVTVTETILEDVSFQFAEEPFTYLPYSCNFVDGAECIVTWDGTDYETIVEHDDDAYFFGNPLLLGLDPDAEDNGQPFAVGYIPASQMLLISGTDTSFPANHTIKIVATSDYTNIHKLDNKFINSEWMASKEIIDIDILPETTISLTDDVWTKFVSLSYDKLAEITVVWNGVSYTCIPVPIADTLYYFGNLSDMLGIPSDCPFTGTVDNAIINLGSTTAGDYTVQITAKAVAYNKLPKQYLPDNLVATRLKNMAGAINRPVYINSNGTPVQINYQINKTVPSNAVFTDTTYTLSQNGSTIILTDSNGKTSSVTVVGDNGAGSNSGLPAVTTNDNGKSLSVVNGAWQVEKLSYNNLNDKPIPSISTSDNGKSLNVVNGKWQVEKLSYNNLSDKPIPSASASDEGAFLRVVNGAWSAVIVPSAEEGEF